MRIGIAQVNTIVGDLEHNSSKIKEFIKKGGERRIDLLIFPELTLNGYPPTDNVFYDSYMEKTVVKLKEIAQFSKNYDMEIVIGFIDKNRGGFGNPAYNSACLIYKGEIRDIVYKTLLPSYDIFDEKRYFKPNEFCRITKLKNSTSVALIVCEDMWYFKKFKNYTLYEVNPLDTIITQGDVKFIINLSASPYYYGKEEERYDLASFVVKKYNLPLIYANLVGGNDDLIFDGSSFFMNTKGEVVKKAKGFTEDLIYIDSEDLKSGTNPENFVLEKKESLYNAIVLGIKDYFTKSGVSKGVIGLSGGIDSSVCAALVTEAIGKENVIGVTMPSLYSSEGSVDDSKRLAENLGIKFFNVPILELFDQFLKALKPVFGEMPFDVTEENIQARIRGVILMAIANKFKGMVVATGNKSEIATGYTTIYGDMVGGILPLGDLYKHEVYEIGRYYNSLKGKEVIPEPVFQKKPSAELREGQYDEQTLPPYDTLDLVLKMIIEDFMSKKDVIKAGVNEQIVNRTLHLIKGSEFKRKQAPIIIKVKKRAFGRGFRHSITGKFIE